MQRKAEEKVAKQAAGEARRAEAKQKLAAMTEEERAAHKAEVAARLAARKQQDAERKAKKKQVHARSRCSPDSECSSPEGSAAVVRRGLTSVQVLQLRFALCVSLSVRHYNSWDFRMCCCTIRRWWPAGGRRHKVVVISAQAVQQDRRVTHLDFQESRN